MQTYQISSPPDKKQSQTSMNSNFIVHYFVLGVRKKIGENFGIDFPLRNKEIYRYRYIYILLENFFAQFKHSTGKFLYIKFKKKIPTMNRLLNFDKIFSEKCWVWY